MAFTERLGRGKKHLEGRCTLVTLGEDRAQLILTVPFMDLQKKLKDVTDNAHSIHERRLKQNFSLPENIPVVFSLEKKTTGTYQFFRI